MKNIMNEISVGLDLAEEKISAFEDSDRNYAKWNTESKKIGEKNEWDIRELWNNLKHSNM